MKVGPKDSENRKTKPRKQPMQSNLDLKRVNEYFRLSRKEALSLIRELTRTGRQQQALQQLGERGGRSG